MSVKPRMVSIEHLPCFGYCLQTRTADVEQSESPEPTTARRREDNCTAFNDLAVSAYLQSMDADG